METTKERNVNMTSEESRILSDASNGSGVLRAGVANGRWVLESLGLERFGALSAAGVIVAGSTGMVRINLAGTGARA